MGRRRLTVDDDDLHHGDGKEGQRLQRHLDQDSGEDEDQHDGKQAAHDPQSLGDPGTGVRDSASPEDQVA